MQYTILHVSWFSHFMQNIIAIFKVNIIRFIAKYGAMASIDVSRLQTR